MYAYRVEKYKSRQEHMDGVAPALESCGASYLTEAKKVMERMADNGQFYAVVFIARDGEVVAETDDVDQEGV